MQFTDEDLIFGHAPTLAEFLGVSEKTIRRYQRGKQPLPEAWRKLLRLRFEGDLRALGGDEWENFHMNGGKLFLDGWRNGFDPHQIRAMFFRVQLVSHLESEIRARDRRINDLEKDIAIETDRAERYRGLVKQESRWGMMWARIMAE